MKKIDPCLLEHLRQVLDQYSKEIDKLYLQQDLISREQFLKEAVNLAIKASREFEALAKELEIHQEILETMDAIIRSKDFIHLNPPMVH